jgi:UDP-N-acetyl-2-amino-2-deoxyglucuronate dehydrogenase
MEIKRVGIIGCGKIFPRHVQAIESNSDYELKAICDINSDILFEQNQTLGVQTFTNYKQMAKQPDIDFVVIATPNSQHFEQAIFCIQNGCDVLLEKPATLNPEEIDILIFEAQKNGRNAYAVLQVRLNSCIQNLKYLIDNDMIGKIRGFGLIQRWQRPKEYFDDWRGKPKVGGGTLHECGIHYLDVLCYLLGKPNVISAKKYNTKHKNIEIEDTIYSTLDFINFGGNIEVTISSEPRNLECSLAILTEHGFIKIAGKAMNALEEVSFLNDELQLKVENIFKKNSTVGTPNSYGTYAGSCPNHPELYKNIQDFNLNETKNVLQLIDKIYQSCGIKYH